jgi:uncharacterized protein with FMN-binding domain
MRRITMWFLATVVVVVLLFSYRTSTMGPAGSGPAAAGGNAPGIVSGGPAGSAAGPPGNGSGAGSGGGSGSGSGAGSGSGSAAGANTGDVVVNGTVAQTRWGPVQVQVHIASGKITDVKALQVPNGNRTDDEINSYAVPQLRSEVLQAQSANIDGVSGATVTSGGYVESLQAALDAAHFRG